jgi:DNA (cytosine-5)-methyltransferase 1
MEKIKIVSLFSGCGGADLGILGGFNYLGQYYDTNPTEILYANDIDKDAVKTYEYNFGRHIHCEDIREIPSHEFPNHDILVGGFPCQTFSIVGKRAGFEDPRGELYLEIIRLLNDKKPMCFIAENVKGLTNINKGKLFQKILKDCDSAGYDVDFRILNAANYGIPQKRQRVFVIGFRKELKVKFNFPSISDSLIPLKSVLEDIKDERYFFSEKAVQGLKNSNKSFNKGRAQDIEQPCNTVSSHLAKVSLNSTDPVLLIDAEKERYRRFTILEAQRIQSFPDNFKFPVSEHQGYRQIGNAIPPVLMWHIIQSIKDIILEIKNKEVSSLV